MSEELKEFAVGFYHEESGVMYIKANTQEEANKLGKKELESNGLDDVKHTVKNRNYDTTGAW